jgi:putative endopeptidase
MKTFLLSAASALALLGAGPALADDHPCLDLACNTVGLFEAPEPGQAAAKTATSGATLGGWGFDLAGRDTSVRPGVSFFDYANGAWAKSTPIPADRSQYGMFHYIDDVAQAQSRAILEDAVAGRVQDGDAAKLGAAYGSFMDQARVNALGAQPLQPTIARIRAARTHVDIARLMGEGQKSPTASLFGAYIGDDAKNPEIYSLYLSQAGLGLPDRDYYLDAKFAPQKAKYETYVAETLGRIGWADPAAAAKAIVALETRIAEVSWTRGERRDRDKTYNLTPVAELDRLAPGFPWAAYMQAADLTKAQAAIVRENTAFPKLAAIFAETPVETWKAWQAFRTTDNASPYLSDAFVEARFDFRGRTLQGQPQNRERWKRAVAFAEGAVGESLGRVYVARHFPPESKAKMDALVVNVKSAMKTRIENLTWMSPETKAKALEKLSKFGLKIGYPSKWRDYSGLEVRADDLFGNMQRSAAFEWAYDVSRLGGPVDDEEWAMTPQTVNAYYSSTKNEIVFPAAILQPPFFDPNADPAVNYGGIGGVIGHEITHGFDDQGRKSDGDGVLRDWWTAADAERFNAEATKLGAQYAAYEALPGLKLDAQVGMGENIADLGGVLLALDAYKLSLNGRPAPVLDGYTGEQRVLLGWAQVWRTKFRDDALRQQVVTGPHSPGQFRAFAPLRNVDAWYSAFDVKPTDPMYVPPEQRARVW